MRKEAVFSIQDLRHVSIACPHCGTLVTLDMARYERKIPPRAGDRRAFTPVQCPACQVPYDSALSALDALQNAYAELSKLGEAVTFHAAPEEQGGK